jgi:hypothetical protein
MLSLIHLYLDFQRVHIDNVPTPVRVKLPPAEVGETISPAWAALAVMTPANGMP